MAAGEDQRSGHAGSSQNSDNVFSFQFKQQYLTLKTLIISLLESRHTKGFN